MDGLDQRVVDGIAPPAPTFEELIDHMPVKAVPALSFTAALRRGYRELDRRDTLRLWSEQRATRVQDFMVVLNRRLRAPRE